MSLRGALRGAPRARPPWRARSWMVAALLGVVVSGWSTRGTAADGGLPEDAGGDRGTSARDDAGAPPASADAGVPAEPAEIDAGAAAGAAVPEATPARGAPVPAPPGAPAGLPPPPPEPPAVPAAEPNGDNGGANGDDDAAAGAKPDAPAPRKKAAAAVTLHGYLQVRYVHRDDTNDNGATDPSTVYVPRARVAVKGRITPGVRFQIEGDLTEPMHPLKDGYLSLEMIPRHRIRIGQQKTPFGWEQRQSAVRLLVVRRAEVTRALARGPDPRDIGVQVLGDWDLPAGLGLHYAVALVNGAGANVIEDDTPRKNLWGRAGMSWISPGRAVVIAAGGSYANGDRLGEADPGATPLAFVFHRIGADLEIETPYVAGVAEYIFGIDHRTLDTVHAGGYYVLLWGRTPWNAAPIVRYQAYDPDLDAAGERISRFTVGGYYDLLPVRARLLVNYDIDLSIDRRDNGLFVQAQVVF